MKDEKSYTFMKQKRRGKLMSANSELKKEIRRSTVKQWQIADYLEMSESALSKSLRYELSDDERKAIKEAIKALEK